MIGFLLAIFSPFFSEASLAIGKNEMKNKREDIFSFIFLGIIFNFILYIIIILINPASYVFSLQSLPTFIVRMIIEIILSFLTATAILKADRTTFSLFRIIAIPLLLLTDVILGYSLNANQIIGIILLVIGMIITYIDGAVSKKGLKIIIISSLGSVITISLYKYNITHFNSFVAEQLLATGIILIVSYLYIVLKEKQNPFALLAKKTLFMQSFFEGLAGVINSFAYTFLPASIILALSRVASISWAMVFGKVYFKEKHIYHKIAIGAVIVTGFIFLMN